MSLSAETGSLVSTTFRPLGSRIRCVVKVFLRLPGQVATIAPSSTQLIDTISRLECVRVAATVIELGPGGGGTTAGWLSNMRPDAKLVAIEKTQAFREVLDRIHDPRLTVKADAIQLPDILKEHDLSSVDVVVSGLPFSVLPQATANSIAASIHQALSPGGTWIAYTLHHDVVHYTAPPLRSSENRTRAVEPSATDGLCVDENRYPSDKFKLNPWLAGTRIDR